MRIRIAEPAALSGGYGLGIGAHVTVQTGTFHGWACNLAGRSHRGFVARPVILPQGAHQQSLTTPASMSAATSRRLHLKACRDAPLAETHWGNKESLARTWHLPSWARRQVALTSLGGPRRMPGRLSALSGNWSKWERIGHPLGWIGVGCRA